MHKGIKNILYLINLICKWRIEDLILILYEQSENCTTSKILFVNKLIIGAVFVAVMCIDDENYNLRVCKASG